MRVAVPGGSAGPTVSVAVLVAVSAAVGDGPGVSAAGRVAVGVSVAVGVGEGVRVAVRVGVAVVSGGGVAVAGSGVAVKGSGVSTPAPLRIHPMERFQTPSSVPARSVSLSTGSSAKLFTPKRPIPSLKGSQVRP
jgi:hypothetical protein